MKIKIESDEYYPRYYLSKKGWFEIDITEEKFKEYKRIEKGWNEMQKELRERENELSD